MRLWPHCRLCRAVAFSIARHSASDVTEGLATNNRRDREAPRLQHGVG